MSTDGQAQGSLLPALTTCPADCDNAHFPSLLEEEELPFQVLLHPSPTLPF